MNNFEKENKKMFDEEDYIKIFDNLTDIYNYFSNKSIRDENDSREKNIKNLSREFVKIKDLEKNNFNVILKISFIIELSNNMAHNVEKEIKKDKGTNAKEFFKIKNCLFDIKTQALSKCIKIARNTKEVIIGKTRDDTKEFNKDVIVLDLPGYGQLSWHTTLNRYGSKEMAELPEYKFEIDKSGGDTYLNLNSKILCEHYSKNEMNTHNRLVKNVTEGREEELKRLLNVYENISKNSNSLISEREKLDESSKLYGLLSEDNFNILVEQYYGYEIDNDEKYKQEIREWRYEYPEEREDGDPIEEEKNER